MSIFQVGDYSVKGKSKLEALYKRTKSGMWLNMNCTS